MVGCDFVADLDRCRTGKRVGQRRVDRRRADVRAAVDFHFPGGLCWPENQAVVDDQPFRHSDIRVIHPEIARIGEAAGDDRRRRRLGAYQVDVGVERA